MRTQVLVLAALRQGKAEFEAALSGNPTRKFWSCAISECYRKLILQ